MRLSLDRVSAEALARMRGVLTREETARVDRFVHEADRVRALAGRAALRLLLSQATGAHPLRIAVETGPLGKPLLRGGPEFNLAHGGGVVLIGFARDQPVGVDVEPLASGAAWRDIVRRLHPAERAAILGAADPAATFIRIWTRKEAVSKACGLGLSVDTRLWAVSAEAPGVVVPPTGVGSANDWTVMDLTPAVGHPGAAAVAGPASARCWTFEFPPEATG
jgi:4'-phosphopantetheinyl transferase